MSSPFVTALCYTAETKHAAEAGSGQAWLIEERAKLLDMQMDEDCALVLQSSINGKAESYAHMKRSDRLSAIQRAIELHGDGSAGSGDNGPARTRQIRLTNTNFFS